MKNIFLSMTIAMILLVVANSICAQDKKIMKEEKKRARLEKQQQNMKKVIGIINGESFEVMGVFEYEVPRLEKPSSRDAYRVLTIRDKMLFQNNGVGTPDFGINITINTRGAVRAEVSVKGVEMTFYEEAFGHPRFKVIDRNGRYIGKLKSVDSLGVCRLVILKTMDSLVNSVNLEIDTVIDTVDFRITE